MEINNTKLIIEGSEVFSGTIRKREDEGERGGGGRI